MCLAEILNQCLENHKSTLTRFQFSKKGSIKDIECKFLESLSKCFNLELLTFNNAMTRITLEEIFTDSFLQYSHLREINLHECTFTDDDLAFFQNVFIRLKHLFKAYLDFFLVSKTQFNQFFNQLQYLDINADRISFEGTFKDAASESLYRIYKNI